MPDASIPATSAPAAHSRPRDYWDPRWGAEIRGQGVDETAEPWFRWLPLMRAYGLVVLAVALVAGFPRDDPQGWRGPLAIAVLAALVADFAVMWIRRPLWRYQARTIAIHGLFLLAAYSVLVAVSPAFAVLQALIYPQVLFSLRPRWSVAGGLWIGAVTAGALLFLDGTDLSTALPGLVFNLVTPVMLIAIAIWIRETIAQSLERRALIAELTAARRDAEAAERKAGAAEERARLAREIHDTLAQGFASVVTHLEAADAYLPGDVERARRDVRAAEDVARASLGEARTLVWALRPETIAAGGLPAAIERVAAAARSAAGPAIEIEVTGPQWQLHPEVEVTLLRAAQEALANARRHAAASLVTVTLTYFADQVSLDVTDDGRGFDPEIAVRSGGMGLRGMRERAERLGGSVAIESAPGEGTAIAVTLPALEPPRPDAGPTATPADVAGEAGAVR